MIISASRRTDIPAYYSEWFFNRLKEGYVCVRNPMNIHQISRISLRPAVVDGIVFWTKNPLPMLDRLDELKEYTYYFQFTITAYGNDVEKNLPSKKEVIIPAFQKLSKMLGSERVIWRYDPIFLSEKYSMECHKKTFEYIARRLQGYTKKCVISFLDLYRNTRNNTKSLGLLPLEPKEMKEIAEQLSAIAKKYGIILESCSEEIDLEEYGVQHGHCIDNSLFELLLGCKLTTDKDKNQRKECGCFSSIDIGMYNTCKNYCVYCYANYSQTTVTKNFNLHNPGSPLLSGEILTEDKVNDRKVSSCRECQLSMFDI